jgi:hypothetical protein
MDNTSTPRQLKGYHFEKLVQNKIADMGFLSNPLDTIDQWKCSQGKGADFIKRVCGKLIEIEAKFSHARIYPSWVERDHLTRFSKNADIKIIVTNRGMQLSDEVLDLYKENNVEHVYFDEIHLLLDELIQGLWSVISLLNLVKVNSIVNCLYQLFFQFLEILKDKDIVKFKISEKSRALDIIEPKSFSKNLRSSVKDSPYARQFRKYFIKPMTSIIFEENPLKSDIISKNTLESEFLLKINLMHPW